MLNPQLFLAKVGKGKTSLVSPKKHTIFSQGDAAEAVFYIQAGKVKLTVVSQQGKEAVLFRRVVPCRTGDSDNDCDRRRRVQSCTHRQGGHGSRASRRACLHGAVYDRKLGFIDYNGEVHVHSSLLNVVLHD